MSDLDYLMLLAASAATRNALLQARHKEDVSGDVEVVDAWVRWCERIAERAAGAGAATASSLLVQPDSDVSETVIDALVRTQSAQDERVRAQAKHDNAIEDHRATYLSEWQQRAKSHSQRSPAEMLTGLWDSGLSWRDIARLLKVSVAAVQKWRSGEKMSPKNFANLRDFVAAYDMIAAHRPGVDIASWLDVPIITDVPITPRHLWSGGDRGMFFEYALGNLKPEDALDSLDPNWRTIYRDDGFGMYAGDDGNLGIRMKNR